jgi:lysozyme
VSHYQGIVDWPDVKRAGASFTGIKATEGHGFVDPEFERNWHGSRWNGVGLIRIAYHYAHIEGNAKAQAKHFVDAVNRAGGFHNGDFAALDAEDVCNASKRVSKVATAEWCKEWLDEVVRLTGLPRKRVVVYTGMWWWVPRAGASRIASAAGHPLWLSGYTVAPPKVFGWPNWTFWQYTSSARTPGINGKSDANQFRGRTWRLRRLSGLPWRKWLGKW